MKTADVENKRTQYNNECGFKRIYDHFYAHVSKSDSEEEKDGMRNRRIRNEFFSRYFSVAYLFLWHGEGISLEI